MNWLSRKLGIWVVNPLHDFIQEYNTLSVDLKESTGEYIKTLNLGLLPPIHTSIVLEDLNKRFYVEGIEISNNGTTMVLYGRLTSFPIQGTVL